MHICYVFVGTGSYIPKLVVPTSAFLKDEFYGEDKKRIEKPNQEIIEKLEEKTTIKERRYVTDGINTSDIAFFAAKDALESSGIDKEDIKYIFVAHNFGDVVSKGTTFDLVPSIASRIKHELGIKNTGVMAHDLICSHDVLDKIVQSSERSLILGEEIAYRSLDPHAGYEIARGIIDSSGIDGEGLESLIIVHDSGYVPCLASRVKDLLEIENSEVITSDYIGGCAGGLGALKLVKENLKVGEMALVIGAETLSRVSDPHDMDSMIYADGAGAVIVKAIESEEPVGILSHVGRSYTGKYAYLLRMGESYNPNYKITGKLLKMQGPKLHGFVLGQGPRVVKESLDMAGLSIDDVNKLFIHQANARMDNLVLKRLFSSYGRFKDITDDAVKENSKEWREISEKIMPMTISYYGNSSGATNFTVFDLCSKGKLEGHKLNSGDCCVLVSFGAGMNIVSEAYRVP